MPSTLDSEPRSSSTGRGRLLQRAGERGWARALSLLTPLLMIQLLFVRQVARSSHVADGVRWHWLDDDQMISMRFARNLAEGHGLVFNPGEYVEGYTNFLWTLLMAGVHWLGADDATAALDVRGIAALLLLVVVALSRDLLRQFGVESHWVHWAVGASVVACVDVSFWALLGYSTPLLTALYLFVLVRLLQSGSLGLSGAIALSLVPLVRADALVLWGAASLFALAISERRPAVLRTLIVTLAPWGAHLAFRLAYYGDVFPNTYYLKVTGRGNHFETGGLYLLEFVVRYPFLLVMASVATVVLWRRHGLRALALPATLVPLCLYAVVSGGDNFRPFRFFAVAMPLCIVWVGAVVNAGLVASTPLARGTWLTLLVLSVAPLEASHADVTRMLDNGQPFEHLRAGLWLRKNASADAAVAVIPAGIVPYVSRLRSYDLLGKCDRHVARLPHRALAGIGHGKFDPPYTLGRRPDYVVTSTPLATVRAAPGRAATWTEREGSPDYALALALATEFRRDYLEHPVPPEQYDPDNSLFVRADSPELERRARWQPVRPPVD